MFWLLILVVLFLLAGFLGQVVAVLQDVWKNGSVAAKIFAGLLVAVPLLAITWLVAAALGHPF